jgi:hypothetical protein
MPLLGTSFPSIACSCPWARSASAAQHLHTPPASAHHRAHARATHSRVPPGATRSAPSERPAPAHLRPCAHRHCLPLLLLLRVPSCHTEPSAHFTPMRPVPMRLCYHLNLPLGSYIRARACSLLPARLLGARHHPCSSPRSRTRAVHCSPPTCSGSPAPHPGLAPHRLAPGVARRSGWPPPCALRSPGSAPAPVPPSTGLQRRPQSRSLPRASALPAACLFDPLAARLWLLR